MGMWLPITGPWPESIRFTANSMTCKSKQAPRASTLPARARAPPCRPSRRARRRTAPAEQRRHAVMHLGHETVRLGDDHGAGADRLARLLVVPPIPRAGGGLNRIGSTVSATSSVCPRLQTYRCVAANRRFGPAADTRCADALGEGTLEPHIPQLSVTLPAASICGCFSIFRIEPMWVTHGCAERNQTCAFGTIWSR